MEKNINIHLYIIWPNAVPQKDKIIEILNSFFDILYVYKIELDRNKTVDIMKKLYEFTEEESIEKINICGYGKIYVILVRDSSKEKIEIDMKYGYIPVHRLAYEVKQKVRQAIGNNSLFHGTMTDFELENDYYSCFYKGFNYEDFYSARLWNGIIKVISYE